MRIVTREELRLDLWAALVVKKPWQKRALQITRETTLHAMIDEILLRVLGSPQNEHVLLASSSVVQQAGEWPGRWGKDEPHPVELLPPGTLKLHRILYTAQ